MAAGKAMRGTGRGPRGLAECSAAQWGPVLLNLLMSDGSVRTSPCSSASDSDNTSAPRAMVFADDASKQRLGVSESLQPQRAYWCSTFVRRRGTIRCP